MLAKRKTVYSENYSGLMTGSLQSQRVNVSNDKPKVDGRDPESGRFLTGNNGGGRQKGSRNKYATEFIDDFHADWQEGGIEVIKKVRQRSPEVYLRVAASLLPKDVLIQALSVNVDVDADRFAVDSIEGILETVAREVGPEAAMTLAAMFDLEVPPSISPTMIELNPEAEASWRCDEVSPAVRAILRDGNPNNVRSSLARLLRQNALSADDMAFIEERCDPDTMEYLARMARTTRIRH
jgi:hypothetical protein